MQPPHEGNLVVIGRPGLTGLACAHRIAYCVASGLPNLVVACDFGNGHCRIFV
jgi:hypothetical protein